MVKSSRLINELLTRDLVKATDSQQGFIQLARKLIAVAEIAYSRRDLRALHESSVLLSVLPIPHAKRVGLWYQSIALKREGRIIEAVENLELLISDHQTAPRFRARALQALGRINHISGNLDTARDLYSESARYIRQTLPQDAFTFANSIILHSHTQADEGDSRQALKDLLSIQNLIEVIRHPLLTATYCNNVAVELFELGQVSEAAHYSQVACQSPLACAYPEWQETALEIEQQTAKRNAVTAVVLSETQTQKRPTQPKYLLVVLQFSLPVRVAHPVVFRQRITCNNPTVALVALVARIRAPSL